MTFLGGWLAPSSAAGRELPAGATHTRARDRDARARKRQARSNDSRSSRTTSIDGPSRAVRTALRSASDRVPVRSRSDSLSASINARITCARLMATPLAARMSAPSRSRNTICRSNSTTVTLVQCSVCDGRRPRFFGRVLSLLSTRGMKMSWPLLPMRRDLPGVRVAIMYLIVPPSRRPDGMHFNYYVVNSAAGY